MDIRHYYLEKGKGDTLILLHGNGEGGEYFENQTEALSQHYHIYVIDTRGHGKTPRGEGEFTIKRFADDLYGFMTEKGIEKANILGFSDGGNIALYFALKHQDMIEKLILNGANIFPKGVKEPYYSEILDAYEKAKQKGPEAVREAEMLGLMVNEPDITPEQLETIKVKTLVIVGDNDMIDEEHTKLIASSIPNAELTVLPGTHFIAHDNHEEFNKKIIEFLG